MTHKQAHFRALLLGALLVTRSAAGAETDPSPELVARRGLAHQLLQSGKAHEAADEARRALGVHTGDADLLRTLAEASEAEGRKAAAADAWERYFEKVGRGSLGERVQLLRLYGSLGRRDRMRRGARELTPAAGDTGQDVLNLYGLLLELNDLPGAERARRFLDSASLSSDEAQELRAEQLVLQGRHLEAAAIFGRLFRKLGRRELGWQEVHAFANAGHRRAAFARAVQLVPGEGAGEDLLFTGELALDLDELSWVERIVARVPESHSPDAGLLHARLREVQGRETSALAVVERARQRAPRHAALRALHAQLLVEQGRAAEALDVITPALAGLGSVGEASAAISVMRALGREADAGALSDRLVSATSLSAADRLDAVGFLTGQQDWPRAAAALARMHAAGGDADLRELARLQIAHGQGQAPEALARALPGVLPGLDQNARLDAIELLVRLGEHGAALAQLRALAPKTAPRQLRAALLAYRAEVESTGSRPAAAEHLARARAALTGEMRVPAELVIALGSMGESDAAAALVNAAPGRDLADTQAAIARSELEEPARRAAAAAVLTRLAATPPAGDAARLDLAEGLMEIGQEELAVGLVSGDAAVAPAEAVRRIVLQARVRAARGDRGGASRLLGQECGRALPGDDQLLVAEARLNLPDPSGAAALFVRLPPRIGESARAILGLADCRMLEGRMTEARALVTQAVGASAEADVRALELAELTLLIGDPTGAARRHAALPVAVRTSFHGRLLAGQLALADDAPAAVPEIAKELGAGGVDPLVASLGARGLVAIHRPLPAKELLEAALVRFPGNPSLCDDLADAYHEMNQPAEALTVLDRCLAALQEAGIEPIALLELARARTLVRLARPAEAEAILARLEPRDPQNADFLRERAAVLAKRGDFAGALVLQRRAVAAQARPPAVEEITVGAYLLEAEGRPAAQAHLEQLAVRRPGQLDVEAALGELLTMGNHTRDASISALQKVVARSPQHPSRAPLASVLLNQDHLHAAEHELEHFQHERPFDVAGDLVDANVHIARQELRDADDILARERAHRPYDEDVFVGSTSLARTLGDGYRGEARSFARTARKLAPRASAVERVARPLFSPGLVAEATSEAGSDTLERRLVFEQYTFPMGDHAKGRVGTRYRDVHRVSGSRDFVDVAAGATFNPWTGGAISVDALAGTGGVLGTEVLPTVAYEHTFRSGSNVGASVGRRRIEESPEAVAVDLTSEPVTAHAELLWGRVQARVTGLHETVSDGNVRRQATAMARVRATPRVFGVVEHEERRSRFEPDPFFLYFAPLVYHSTAVGFDLDPLVVVNQLRLSLMPRVISDSLDGARAHGGSVTCQLAYSTPSGGRLAMDLEHYFMGATRRLDLDAVPFHQNNLSINYATTF